MNLDISFLTGFRILTKALLASFQAANVSLFQEIGRDALLPNKTLSIIVILSAVALGSGFMTLSIGIPDSPCTGVVGTTRNFTLVGTETGYNDSRNQPAPWPVMSVNRCDMVIIKVINDDTQSHGLAVSYYAARGTEIVGGQSATVQFLATKQGQFKVYCNLATCTIHIFMENGLLNVT